MASLGKIKSWAGKGANFGVVAAFTAFAAFPFLWMAITTFKETRDLLDPNNNPFLYNMPPTLENLRALFYDTMYVKWLWNTAFARGVRRSHHLGPGPARRIQPGEAGRARAAESGSSYVPRAPDDPLHPALPRRRPPPGCRTLWSLVLVYPSFTVPFCTWLLMGFFKSIPKDIEEAAMIDGLSRFGAFVKVILPMSVAGVLTVIIFTFTLVMQEFVYALTFITAASNFTVSVGVPTFLVRGDVYFWGSLMAACFIASFPIAILYNFFVDRFIAGFTVGAIK
jgi:multiple sugar transport system permease protein